MDTELEKEGSRHFLGTAAMTIAATQLGGIPFADAVIAVDGSARRSS